MEKSAGLVPITESLYMGWFKRKSNYRYVIQTRNDGTIIAKVQRRDHYMDGGVHWVELWAQEYEPGRELAAADHCKNRIDEIIYGLVDHSKTKVVRYP